jgi:hypothetical protein
LGCFPANIEAVSNEHGERLHQDFFQTEKRYSGKGSSNMLADYCWSLIMETSAGENKRHKKKCLMIIFWPGYRI